MRRLAETYLATGWTPLPIVPGEKRPAPEAWQSWSPDVAREALAAGAFDGVTAIGVLLGPASGDLVDIDIDVPEAVPFADRLLPPTLTFGRPGNPRSHRLYHSPGARPAMHKDVRGAAATREQQTGRKMLIEIRAVGQQSVFPGSTHPSGETIAWEAPARPTTISAEDLAQLVGQVAGGALLVRSWPDSGRHEAQLALAGALALSGWPEGDALDFLVLVCGGAGDPDPGKRAATVSRTYALVAEQEPVLSWPALAKSIGREAASQAKTWLGGTTAGTGRFVWGDHAELAARLITDLGPRSEVLSCEGSIYRYEGGTYRPVPPDVLGRTVYGYAHVPVGDKGAPLKISKRDMLDVPAVAAMVLSEPDAFAQEAGISLSDGVVIVSAAGAVPVPHSPALRTRSGRPYPWTDDPPQAFLSFCAEVLTPEDTEYVREFLGIALLGLAPRFGKALVLQGEGGNGKGVLTHVLTACFAEDLSRPEDVPAVVGIAPQDWTDEYARAQISQARMNVVGELPSAEMTRSEAFKGIITGDRQNARRPYGAGFVFVPRCAHVFSANRLPPVRDLTDGFWRRLTLVTLKRSFGVRPGDTPELALLRDSLVADVPRIVCWALRGAAQTLARGRYPDHAASAAAVADWRNSADAVGSFLAGATTAGETAPTALYASFRLWCAANGYQPPNSRTFAQRLESLGSPSRKTRDGWRYPLAYDPAAADRAEPVLRLVK